MSTHDTVAAEAGRIRLGEHFCSFEEFDRCLDSLAVMNGHAMSRYRTGDTRCIRVCRFGKLARSSAHEGSVKAKGNPEDMPDTVFKPSDDDNVVPIDNVDATISTSQ
jgi:hypothetical protein